MTPREQWEAALARLDERERSSVLWRYRNQQRFMDRGAWSFDDLAPTVQYRWIDYARKRARTYPRG